MKKSVKRLLSFMLVLCIVISAGITFNINKAHAANGTITDDNGNTIRWSLNTDGVFTVNGACYGSNYTATSCPWKDYRENIKTVIIEPGMQAIGDYWFYNCYQLTSVELPDSLLKIGRYSFYNCTSLECFEFPENCCEYYDNLFYGCNSLKWAILPNDNTSSNYPHRIPTNTFRGCTNLENVWVGAGHTTVDASAFRSCTSLKSIVWTGDTLSSVGNYFPSNASFVGSAAIESRCSALNKNYIPLSGSTSSSLNYSYDLSTKALSFTGSGAIDDCPWLNWRFFVKSVDLSGATSIAQEAFDECVYLTGELEVPESVSYIGPNAFDYTNYSSVILNSESVQLDECAFNVDNEIIFFGKPGSGAYDYITETDNSIWRYYCIGAHEFSGEHAKCANCDLVNNELTISELGSHDYIYQYRLGNTLYFKCAECDIDDYGISARELLLNFSFVVNEDGAAFEQADYDGRFDIIRDGFVNMRDYEFISDICKGEPTEYDMNLTNENATPEAQAVFRYITSVNGSKIISGQQESTWMSGIEETGWVGGSEYEMSFLYKTTGHYPAIRGLDFMGDDFYGVVNRAKDWADRGGIVTICWHCSKAFDQSYYQCKVVDDNGNPVAENAFTQAEWEAVLTEGTAEHDAFIAGMDKAGAALKQLQDAGVPVLWRPFHEFDGAWFWWGCYKEVNNGETKLVSCPEYFTRLWIMMYNHYTYDLGLNNLIWVLGYSHNGTDYGTDLADWYPGSRYVDIAGADSYEVSTNGAEGRLYNPVLKTTYGAKPLTMHETGVVPSVEQFENVPWAYFMTWHSEYLIHTNPDIDTSSPADLYAIYNSDYVITLDELPKLY